MLGRYWNGLMSNEQWAKYWVMDGVGNTTVWLLEHLRCWKLRNDVLELQAVLMSKAKKWWTKAKTKDIILISTCLGVAASPMARAVATVAIADSIASLVNKMVNNMANNIIWLICCLVLLGSSLVPSCAYKVLRQNGLGSLCHYQGGKEFQPPLENHLSAGQPEQNTWQLP